MTWLNRTEETRAPYDLTICERGKSAHRGGGGTSSSAVSVFIEVKTTRYRESNVFDLSYFEWEFMSHEPPVRYHIYHVTGAGDPAGARITIIVGRRREPLEKRKGGRPFINAMPASSPGDGGEILLFIWN